MLKRLILSVTSVFIALSAHGQWNDQFPQFSEFTNAYDVAVLSERQILLAGDYRQGLTTQAKIMKSEDGGSSFRSVLTIEDAVFDAIAFKNEVVIATGVSTDSEVLFAVSLNNGDDWEVTTVEGASGNYVSQSFMTDQIGVIATSLGMVLKTVDGGNSWQVLYQETIDLSSVKMISEEVIVMVSRDLKLYKTVDGGANWVMMQDLDRRLTTRPKLEVATETNFFLLADNELYITETGGVTFYDRSFSTYRLNDIQFINGVIGYAVGTNNRGAGIIVTMDGGLSWQEAHNAGAGSFYYNALDIRDGFIYTAGFASFSFVAALDGTPDITALISGYAEFCPGDAVDLSMSFTGLSPWTVSYRDIDGNQQDLFIHASDTTFEVFPTENSFPRWIQVRDRRRRIAFESNAARFLKNLSLDAQFAVSSDTVCMGDSYPVAITLDGCEPWEVTVTDGAETTVYQEVTANPFVFEVVAAEDVTYEILSVSDITGEKELTEAPSFELLVSNASQTAFEENELSACISDSAGLVVNYTGRYLPWSYSYEMGGNTFVRENLHEPTDHIPVQTLGTYEVSLLSVSSECGEYPLDQTATVFIDGLEPPVITEVIRHGFDSITVSWSYDFIETDTLYLERSINGTVKLLDTLVSSTSYADTEVLEGRKYNYQLVLKNSVECLSFSETAGIDVPLGFEEVQFDTLYAGHTANQYQSAWIDLDQDGYEDVISRFSYLNNGGERVTKAPLVAQDLDFLITDFNNDDRWDRAGAGKIEMGYSDGVFDTLIENRIIRHPSVGDLDGDGLLDLIASGVNSDGRYLYMNENGNFVRSTSSGVPNGRGFSFTLVDYNHDHLTDIVIDANHSVEIYTNKGNAQFERNRNLRYGQSFTINNSVWADFNNDGLIDFYVFTYLGHSMLYINKGDGTYSEMPLDTRGQLAGAAAADYDNDGWLDIIISSASKSHQLFKNNKGGGFSKVQSFDSLLFNPSGLAFGHSITWGDFNKDGKLDPYIGRVINGVFLNKTTERNWLQVAVRGNVSNSLGINTKMKVWATIDGEPTVQYREVLSKNEGEQNSLIQHFGLGDATRVDSVEIRWTSGIVWKGTNIDVNQRLEVTEPDPEEVPTMADSISSSTFSPHAISLEWTDTDHTELGFVIERSPDNVAFEVVDTVARAYTRYRDRGLSPNTQYYYRFYSFNAAGASIYSNVTTATTFPPCTLEAVIATDQPDAADIQFPTLTANTGADYQYQWLLNDAPISGANNTIYLTDRDGFYSVVIRDGFNCVDTSNVIAVSPFLELKDLSSIVLEDQGFLGGVHWIDMNNDGLADYFTNTGTYFIAQTDGTYLEEPYGEGLPILADEIYVADFNKDGILDYYANSRSTTQVDHFCFTDVTGRLECQQVTPAFYGRTIAAAIGDYDNDGDMEIYSRDRDRFSVFIDWNGEEFRAVSKNLDVESGNSSNQARDPEWADIDNDSDLDLLLSNFINYNEDLEFNDAPFRKLEVDGIIRSSSIVDINNDGRKDILLSGEEGNYLFLQNQDGTFAKNTSFNFLGSENINREMVWEDYDDDGDLDLFLRSHHRLDSIQQYYYENTISTINRGISIGLTGSVSNRMSIGARVYLTATIFGEEVTQMVELNNKGLLWPHFGLGDAPVIDKIRVVWPSGQTMELSDVPSDVGFLGITEPSPEDFCDLPALEVKLDTVAMSCQEQVVLTTNAFFTSDIQWYFGDIPVAGANSNQLAISEAGDYSVQAGTEFCSATSTVLNIGTYQDLLDTLIVSDLLAGCEPGELFLQAATFPGATYEWLFDGGRIPGETTSKLFPQWDGDYQASIMLSPTACAIQSPVVPVNFTDFEVRLTVVNGNTLNAKSEATGLTYRWFKDGILVSEQSEPDFVVPSSGFYYVEIVDVNGCTAISNTINMIVSRTEETASLRGYPNPVLTSYHVPSACGRNARFELINLLGERLTLPDVVWNDGVYEIDLSLLRPGLYMLSEQCETKQRLFKVLKQ